MTQHTPGPWRSHEVFIHGEPIGYEIHAGTELIAARCYGSSTATANTCDRIAANARLIAAAPDLLAALEAASRTLQTVLDFVNKPNSVRNDVYHVHKLARAAIAAAK